METIKKILKVIVLIVVTFYGLVTLLDMFNSSTVGKVFVFTIILLVPVYLHEKLGFKIILSVCFVALAVFFAFMATISMLFGGTFFELHSILMSILYIEFIIYSLLYLIKRSIFIKVQKAFLVVCLLLSLLFGWFYGEYSYAKKLPAIRKPAIDVHLYEPFQENNNLFNLGKKASLQLIEDLPRIDSDIIFYPMVASFVEATYPTGFYQWGSQDLLTTSSNRNYNRLVDGQVDMIFAFLPSKEQEDYAKEKGKQFKFTPIGKEGFVFFVNSSNPIENLSVKQIQDIYSGKITNWQTFDGKLNNIKAFQGLPDSNEQLFLQQIMQSDEIIPAPTENVVKYLGDVVEQIADYKNYSGALGFGFNYSIGKMVQDNTNTIRILKINNIEANAFTIKNNTYPFINKIYVVTTKENVQVNKFTEWILSEEGQTLLEKAGYIKID